MTSMSIAKQNKFRYAKNFPAMHGERIVPLQDNQYIYVENDMYKIVTV